MNRNNIIEINKIAFVLANESDPSRIEEFFSEMLTESELETISKRWRIMEMLYKGHTQREISKEMKVSLCKVTRGSQILKKQNTIIREYIQKGQ